MKSRTTKERRDYPCWAVVEPAPDLPGKWVAHCLEFDTIAQADDFQTAVELVIESTKMTVLEDLQTGADPLERRTQDEEAWEKLGWVLEEPYALEKYAGKSTNDEGLDVIVAVQFSLSYVREVASPFLSPTRARPNLLSARRENLNVACA